MSDVPVTMMVPVPRPEELSQEEFISRWRSLGQTASKLPLWRCMLRYSQCAIVDLDATGLRGTRADAMIPEGYGGMTKADFPSRERWEAFVADPDWAALAIEHRRVFGERKDNRFSVGRYAVGERVPRIESEETPAIRLFAFQRRRPNLTREQFHEEWARFWAENFEPDESLTSHILEYTYHRSLSDNEFVEAGYDGVVEIGFRDPAAVSAFLEAREQAGFVERQPFFDPAESLYLLVTQKVLFEYDHPLAASAS
jgi:hypothetical protein